MIFVKFSQNFIKFPLKFWFISKFFSKKFILKKKSAEDNRSIKDYPACNELIPFNSKC